MRNNQPATQAEYILSADQSPVSRTDLLGNITFVNADFIEIGSHGSPREVIAPTEAIYRRFTTWQARGLRIECGRVVRSGELGLLDRLCARSFGVG